MRVYRMVWEQDGEFHISLAQIIDNVKDDKYRVTYGTQVWNNLTYAEASERLGQAIMHHCGVQGLIQ